MVAPTDFDTFARSSDSSFRAERILFGEEHAGPSIITLAIGSLMDFRTCPACNSSVLEDDAEDCPFCGASMSGKAKPKKPAAAKPAAPAKGSPAKATSPKGGAAAATKGAAKPKPAAKPSAEPDAEADPFEVDTSALRRAAAVSPRQTKTKSLRIVCPMCETPGFISPSDAGRDVRCCNDSCMVPVFKAPRPKQKEVVEEKPASGLSTAMLGLIATVAVAVIGVGVYFFVLKEEPKDPGPTITEPVKRGPSEEELQSLIPKSGLVQETQGPPATPAEILKKSLEELPKVAQQRDNNRSVEFGLQLTIGAFAIADKMADAKSYMKQLDRLVRRRASFYKIEPLVEMAWQQLANGDRDAANATAEEAAGLAKSLPDTSRRTVDAATELSALLAALGRMDEASAIIRREQRDSPRGQLSAIWRSSLNFKTFDVDWEAERPYHILVHDPMWVSVVETLVARGSEDRALEVARAAPSRTAREACVAAWTGGLCRITGGDLNGIKSRIDSVAKEETPAAQVRMYAAAADAALNRQQDETAKQYLEAARAVLAQLPEPKTVAVPSMASLYESDGRPHAGLPNPAPARGAAVAAGDVALIELRVGQTDAAWESIQQAIRHCMAMAPSRTQTAALLERCEKQEGSVRQQLDSTLNLRGDRTKIFNAFNRYRAQCGRLHEEAIRRYELQVELLRAVAQRGLQEKVWPYVVERQNSSDQGVREPFFQSTLPGLTLAIARAQGQSDLVSAVQAAFPDATVKVDVVDFAAARVATIQDSTDVRAVVDYFKPAYRTRDVDRNRIDLVALQTSCRLQKARSAPATFQFVIRIPDPNGLAVEDAFTLLAAHAAQESEASELWRVMSESRELEATHFASLYYGFVSVISEAPPKPVTPPAESPGEAAEAVPAAG